MKDDYCSTCGAFLKGQTKYPRTCPRCGAMIYQNPLPVVVALVPVGKGLVVVRRNNEPKKGQWCLPGGFMSGTETWRQGCARELFEETSLTVEPASISLFDLASSSNKNHLLVFGVTHVLPSLPDNLTHDEEVSEISVIYEGFQELAFPSHTEMARKFFNGWRLP